MKTRLILLIIISILSEVHPFSAVGKGTKDSPYQIVTAQQLDSIRYMPNNCMYLLMNNIDLDSPPFNNTGWKSISFKAKNESEAFSGSFNGNGYLILNMTGESLFNKLQSATVENLGIVNCFVHGGGLAQNSIWGSVIQNCFVQGSFHKWSLSAGTAGITAENNSTIQNCYVIGTVYDHGGGIAGKNHGVIKNCYTVLNNPLHVEPISNPEWEFQNVTNCFFKGERLQTKFGSAKSFKELMMKKTFTDWDFENVWEISEGKSLPGLRGVNDAPFFVTDREMFIKNTPRSFDVAFDLENSLVELNVNTMPMHGKIRIQENRMEYLPEKDFTGLDSINVTAVSRGLKLSRDILLMVFSGGKGELHSPFHIETENELNMLKLAMDKAYLLKSDIDFQDTEYRDNWDPIGDSLYPFTGSFDGNGHFIDNMNIISKSKNFLGLFGCADGAVIKNVTVRNCSVGGYTSTTGSLVGKVSGFTKRAIVENCHSEGTITGQNQIGGLIGNCINSKVFGCSFKGKVAGRSNTGGLVGSLEESTLNQSFSMGSVEGEHANITHDSSCFLPYIPNINVLAGFSLNGAGALIGSSFWKSEITDCYSTAEISEFACLVGNSLKSTINRCYYYGGDTEKNMPVKLIADHKSTIVQNSFYISAKDTAESFAKTSEELKSVSTYLNAGWNFDSVWIIDSSRNCGFPFLRKNRPEK